MYLSFVKPNAQGGGGIVATLAQASRKRMTSLRGVPLHSLTKRFYSSCSCGVRSNNGFFKRCLFATVESATLAIICSRNPPYVIDIKGHG